MKLRSNPDPIDYKQLYEDSYCTNYVAFLSDHHTKLDPCSSKILNSLVKDSFYADLNHRDEDLCGWLCIASYSSLARITGFNPVTVQKRIEAMIEKGIMEIVDVYPRTGRQLVSIYRVFHRDNSNN